MKSLKPIVAAAALTNAGNLARNQLRSRSRRPEISMEANRPDGSPGPIDTLASTATWPDQNALRAEQQSAVREAVAGLPDELREAVVLCELEERTLSEAAGLLNTSVKAIESRLYRARKQLQGGLSKWLSLV
jgi:RNA polymerase sigma-70 factor (ECF subfamily)